MKKILIQFVLVSTFLFLCILNPFNTLAQQQVICRGDRDWGAFISSTISYDGFVEYWEDILIRYNSNICHYMDIDSILKRIDNVRKQVRSAFYACADATRIVETYNELEAELYFLRNYVDTDNGKFLVISDQKLINDMRDYFVIQKNYFSDDQLLALFEKFKVRYTPRLKTYKNCKDPDWQTLVDKWNEFVETGAGAGPALKQAKESAEKKAGQIGDSWQNLTNKWGQMVSSPLNLGSGFFGGLIDAKINGLPPLEGLTQIYQELDKNFPEGYTFEQLQASKSLKEENFKYLSLEAEYMAQYRGLYGETSDRYTFLIVNKLITLQQIIKNTHVFENQTIQCVGRINKKQC